jgi:hypothetical protein
MLHGPSNNDVYHCDGTNKLIKLFLADYKKIGFVENSGDWMTAMKIKIVYRSYA